MCSVERMTFEWINKPKTKNENFTRFSTMIMLFLNPTYTSNDVDATAVSDEEVVNVVTIL